MATTPDRRSDPAPPLAAPVTRGFESAAEHLDAAFGVVRLLLARQIARTWPRLLSAAGTLSDLFVSLPEVRAALFPDRFPTAATEAGLPDLPAIEAALGAAGHALSDRVTATTIDLPIENLRASFGLDPVELAALLVALALQSDLTLHRVAAHAWADFAQKQPTLGFLAEVVAGTPEERDAVLGFAAPGNRVRLLRLVELAPADKWPGATPPLFQGVRVPERVAAFVRGEPSGWGGPTAAPWDGLDAWTSLHAPLPPDLTTADEALLARALSALRHAHRQSRRPVLLLRGPSADDARDLVLLLGGDRRVLQVDLAALGATLAAERWEELLGLAAREATLLGAHLLLVLGDLQAQPAFPALLTALRRVGAAWRDPLFLAAADVGKGLAGALGPLPDVLVGPGAPRARHRVWRRALDVPEGDTGDVARVVEELAHRHALSGQAIRDAARSAQARAALRRSSDPKAAPGVTPQDVLAAVRGQVLHRLGTIAEPFSTQLSWSDFSAPTDLRDRLGEVIAWARHHRQVHEDWGFGRLSGYGRGLSVLLAGPPGTGKTFAAALIAKDLGAELYRVDLSRTVDKYIGETEKNLGRLFDEAERSGAIILFDEADSLFSKRTQVSSSNDRYANLEVNFLLQRMEHFDGTTILTTNFAENLDEAFKRRIKFRLTFRMPTADERAGLWRAMLPAEAPQERGIDFARLGRRFELAPAYIKNCVIRAAFRAAQLGRPIDDELLTAAGRAEYQELGRVVRDD